MHTHVNQYKADLLLALIRIIEINKNYKMLGPDWYTRKMHAMADF